MLGKRTNKFTYDDIVTLLESSEFNEGHRLDFKEKLYPKARENAKYVSSFANANGGILIFGVSDDKEIIGIDRTVGNANVIEWFNQAISGNVEPEIYYYDPLCINIPNSNNILMIVEIPESTRKPHMLKEEHRYYVRLNDSSKPASHYQVRDMFMYSRERKSDFESFYKKRNLNIENPDFALTSLSSKIDRIPERTSLAQLPLIVFSIIPVFLNEEIFKGASQEHISWLDAHMDVNITGRSVRLYYPNYGFESKIDGYISEHYQDRMLRSYFEVLTSGYVESGFSKSFCYPNHEEDLKKDMPAVYIDHLIGYSMNLLKWISQFYSYCNYQDEFLFQISFRDILDSRLYGFRKDFNYTRYKFSDTRNKFNDKFTITKRLAIRELDDEQILEVGKVMSDKISRAFGITQDLLFENGQYPQYGMDRFSLYDY